MCHHPSALDVWGVFIDEIYTTAELFVPDSTSALYGRGKAGVFRKLVQLPDTLPLTDTLASEQASQAEVVQAGLKLLLMLYNGKPDETLNHLRYRLYMNAIAAGKSKLQPERLPPTQRAAHFHTHMELVVCYC